MVNREGRMRGTTRERCSWRGTWAQRENAVVGEELVREELEAQRENAVVGEKLVGEEPEAQLENAVVGEKLVGEDLETQRENAVVGEELVGEEPEAQRENAGIGEELIIIINPLTARIVGAPQMILQPVFSIFPCSPLPSGTCRTPGLSIS